MKLKIKTEHKKLPKGKLSEIRSKPGESNAYKHKGDGPFAGPNHTYPNPSIGKKKGKKSTHDKDM